MNKAEFDEFAQKYRKVHSENIQFSGETVDFFAEYKIKDTAKEFHRFSPNKTPNPKILDFGTGIGNSVPFFNTYFPHAQLTCLDVSESSLELAQQRFPNHAQYVAFDGKKLPFDDHHFNIAFTACVFHHIDHQQHINMLKELNRVITPGGFFIAFEHNPYNPLTRHAVNTCPLDVNAVLITAKKFKHNLIACGFSKVQSKYRIFFPNALRHFRGLEHYLTWLPLGAQYYVIGFKN